MITHVAIKVGETVYSLPPPNRHHNILWTLPKGIARSEQVQGFLCDGTLFMDRKTAMGEARRCGQVIRPPNEGYQGPELFSEDLW